MGVWMQIQSNNTEAVYQLGSFRIGHFFWIFYLLNTDISKQGKYVMSFLLVSFQVHFDISPSRRTMSHPLRNAMLSARACFISRATTIYSSMDVILTTRRGSDKHNTFVTDIIHSFTPKYSILTFSFFIFSVNVSIYIGKRDFHLI